MALINSLFLDPAAKDMYRYVALTASLILFHFLITGFIAPGRARGKIFTPEYMENFKTVHERHFGEGNNAVSKLPKEGYPDMGNGRFSDKMTYKQWFDFNVAQRIHYHYLESVTSVICWILIAGLVYPEVTIALGGGFFLGRVLFHIGYSVKGPQGRSLGFLLQLACSVALGVFSFISSIRLGVNYAK